MSNNIPTPHISAPAGSFAETVLMPGDPLRAKFIADEYLENAKLVNNVRNVRDIPGIIKGNACLLWRVAWAVPLLAYIHMNYSIFIMYRALSESDPPVPFLPQST